MRDLFDSAQPLRHAYAGIYSQLEELREEFHRSGRLDDSNAKLDEVAKLFAAYVAYRSKQISHFPLPKDPQIVIELQRAFAATVKLPSYTRGDSESIFGTEPRISLRDTDSELASNLVRLVRDCVDTAFELRALGEPFDVLNEAFGHFVRDNFRNNVEDAQYMTPPEVVDFMVQIALHDIAAEDSESRNKKKHWTVLDPTCGVGSFLAAFYSRAKETTWLSSKKLRVFGQDKVERMVRLSRINLALFDSEKHEVSIGNSLMTDSPICPLNGEVDVIVTNPPFGAQFDARDVGREFKDNTPFFSSVRGGNKPVDSELLFIDRNLKLLREGGRLLIVIPDGVVSARGTAALLRQHLTEAVTLRAVIELPSVTFAQAGTRTKTAILYLIKGRDRSIPSPAVFFGVVTDLGFQVSTRKGVQRKITEGENQLPAMLEAYFSFQKRTERDDVEILSDEPSCVAVPRSQILAGSWTPSHNSAKRFKTVKALQQDPTLQLVALKDLVEFVGESRSSERCGPDQAFISVLHILGEGFVDVAAARGNEPLTPGTPVKPGEVLLSKINPRIPRVCVVPDFGVPTFCSSEFEVMAPKSNISAYELAFMLQTKVVQDQVCSLTSGTSASHNRIRTSELGQVLVPVPRAGTATAMVREKMVERYTNALRSIVKGTFELASLRQQEGQVFAAEYSRNIDRTA